MAGQHGLRAEEEARRDRGVGTEGSGGRKRKNVRKGEDTQT